MTRVALARAASVGTKWLGAFEAGRIASPDPAKVDRVRAKLEEYANLGAPPPAEGWEKTVREISTRFRRAASSAAFPPDRQLAQDIVRGLEEFEACPTGLFKEIAQRHMEEALAVINGARRHRLHVSTHQPAPHRVWTLLTEASQKREIIRAASAIHPEVWWHGGAGAAYLASNRHKIEEEHVITNRIFIYDPDDKHEMELLDGNGDDRGLLEKNVEAGVHVHKIAWDKAYAILNVIIIGKRYGGRLDVQDRRFIRGYDVLGVEREMEIRGWQREFDSLFSQIDAECVSRQYDPEFNCAGALRLCAELEGVSPE